MNHPFYLAVTPLIAASAALVLAADSPASAAANASAPSSSSIETSAPIPVRGRAPRVVVVDVPPPPAPRGIPLKLGMRGELVKDLLGKPSAVRSIDTPEAKAEVWVYIRSLASQVQPITATMRDVPFVDPISGEMRMLKEPVIDYLTETHEVELRLLMFRGQLINWAEVPIGVKRNYD